MGFLGPRVRQAARSGRGDFLEDRDQPRDVQVERLVAPERLRLRRHRAPGRVVGHVIQGCNQLVARVRRADDMAFTSVLEKLARTIGLWW